MKILTEAEFNTALRSPSGGYLLYGDEDYTKQHALSRLSDAVVGDDPFATFNYIRFGAADYTPARLSAALEAPPMMAEKKLIVLSGISFELMNVSDLEALIAVLANLPEFDYSVLAITVPEGEINEGTAKKPSAAIKKLSEVLTLVRFPKIAPARLGGWVGKHFAANGVAAEPSLCSRLVDYCGASMYKLASEVDKLCWYVLAEGRNSVTDADMLFVSIPDITYDSFSFTNAICDGNKRRALEVLSVMIGNKVDETIILGEISSTLCLMSNIKGLLDEGHSTASIAAKLNLHPYRTGLYAAGVASVSAETLTRLLSLCAEANTSVKLGGGGYAPIERLICSI